MTDCENGTRISQSDLGRLWGTWRTVAFESDSLGDVSSRNVPSGHVRGRVEL